MAESGPVIDVSFKVKDITPKPSSSRQTGAASEQHQERRSGIGRLFKRKSTEEPLTSQSTENEGRSNQGQGIRSSAEIGADRVFAKSMDLSNTADEYMDKWENKIRRAENQETIGEKDARHRRELHEQAKRELIELELQELKKRSGMS